jgi:predicted nucleic acid-binding Zn ribbon protein
MWEKIREFKKICPVCGKKYLAFRISQKTCSIQCRGKSQQKLLIEITCIVCGKKIFVKNKYRNKKFCSQSCASTYNNKNYEYMKGNNNPAKRPKIREKISKKMKDRYMSWMIGKNNHNHKNNGGMKEEVKIKLSINHIGLLAKEKHWNWQGGITLMEYGNEWTKKLRDVIRKRDKFICQICYKNGFVVHHIDYNKKNNNPDNLITLCRSCHVKTNYHRKKWKEYFNMEGNGNGKN